MSSSNRSKLKPLHLVTHEWKEIAYLKICSNLQYERQNRWNWHPICPPSCSVGGLKSEAMVTFCSVLKLLTAAAEKYVHTPDITILSLCNSLWIGCCQPWIHLPILTQNKLACMLSSSRINTHFTPTAYFFRKNCEKSRRKLEDKEWKRSFSPFFMAEYGCFQNILKINLVCHQAARFYWCI